LTENYHAAKLQYNSGKQWQTRAITEIVKSGRDYMIM